MKTIRRLFKNILINNLGFLKEIILKLENLENIELPEINKKFSNIENRINEYENDPYFKLKGLLKVVEPYQPLFGLTIPNYQPKRITKDRVETIEKHLNNNVNGIRILDLGSSLGYIPLYLASKGAIATGWENNENNLHVSNILKEINSSSAIFSSNSLDLNTYKLINSDNFDVVIILSLLHHIIHFQGIDACKTILNYILEIVPQVYIEFATKDELVDLYWKNSLPDNILSLIENKENYNIELLEEYSTHLSTTKRPLYSISKKNLKINNKFYSVKDFKFKAYNESPINIPRIYYTCEKHFIKYCSLDFNNNSSHLRERLIKEVYFSNCLNKYTNVSHLVDYEISPKSAFLVYEKLDGDILSNYISILPFSTKIKVIKQIISIVKELKSLGIYHNDIRLWNFIYNPETEKVNIIDLELASNQEIESNLVSLEHLINDLFSNNVIIHNYPLVKSPDSVNLNNLSEIYDSLKEFEGQNEK